MRILRILAIILNGVLLVMVISAHARYQFVMLDISDYPDEYLLIYCILLLSAAMSIVNVLAMFFVPPLFQRYWFRTCLKGKTLEEQLELVEQARLNALKKDDSDQ